MALNRMKIDLANIESEGQLHCALARELGFPDFYGENWDAFWDSITGLVELPNEIYFVGTENLQRVLPKAFDQLKKCFQELNDEYPEIMCKVTWA